MQLDIFKEPLQYEANASEKKLDAFKQFHTKYASDWIRLDYLSEAFISDVKNIAERIRKDFDALVVIGIGGSFIGAKAFIDALGSDFPIYFTGNMLDSGCITKLLHELRDKRYAINVISKSGTTMETKLVFEIFLEDMKKKGIDLAHGVIVTSSKTSELAKFARVHNIKTFTIPEDIGGRYSVFTAVGILPMAASGLDIDALVLGIKNAKEEYFD
ncbi:MAG: glucose-6-phosphate isomerase, partial [Fenollaria timonensis]